MKSDKKQVIRKIAQEYRNQQKPVHFDYKTPPTSVPQRKFGIIVNAAKDLIQRDMKPEYTNQQDEDLFYWNELLKRFGSTYEMDFVAETIYGKKKQKVRDFIVILMHTKRLFEVLEAIRSSLPHLYKKESAEDANQSEEMQLIENLRDGQYVINSEMITNYNQYSASRTLLEESEKKQRQKEKEEAEKKEKQKLIKEQLERKRQQQEYQRLQFSRQQEEARRKADQQRLQKIKQQELERKKNIDQSWMPKNLNKFYERPRSSAVVPTPEEPQHHQLQTVSGAHRKRSRILYEENYKGQLDMFAFAQQPVPSQEKSECYECHAKLGVGLYFVGYNMNYCNYKGTWYCNNCYSTERKPLPWKARHDFDLRGYGVCNRAALDITSLYERPILQISNDAKVVQTNRVLFNFLYLKRQLHLMYDLICNPDLIKNSLKQRMNYCLKENVFSLKNLYDIYSEQEQVDLEKIIDLLTRHFYQCTDCQKKGYKCMTCKKKQRIFPFELRETKGCPKCERLYHRECINVNGCLCSLS